MSKPQFSKRRGSKRVPTYQLAAKTKTEGSKKSKGQRGRPKRPRPPLTEKPRKNITEDAVCVGVYHETLWITEKDGTKHEPEASKVVFKNCTHVIVDCEEGSAEAKFRRAKVTGEGISHKKGSWPYYDTITIEQLEG